MALLGNTFKGPFQLNETLRMVMRWMALLFPGNKSGTFFPTCPSLRLIYTPDCVVWICSLMRRASLIAVKMCFVCHQTFVAICALLKIERFLKSFFKFAQTGSEPRIFSFIFSHFAAQLQQVPKTRKIFFWNCYTERIEQNYSCPINTGANTIKLFWRNLRH